MKHHLTGAALLALAIQSPLNAQPSQTNPTSASAQAGESMQRGAEEFLQRKEKVRGRRATKVSRQMNATRQGRFRAQAANLARQVEHLEMSQTVVKRLQDSLVEDALQVAAYVAQDGGKRSVVDDRELAGASIRFVQRRPNLQDLSILTDHIVSGQVVAVAEESLSDGYATTVTVRVRRVYSGDAKEGDLLKFRQLQPPSEALPGDATGPSDAENLYFLSQGFYAHSVNGAGRTEASGNPFYARLVSTFRRDGERFVPYEYSTLPPFSVAELSSL